MTRNTNYSLHRNFPKESLSDDKSLGHTVTACFVASALALTIGTALPKDPIGGYYFDGYNVQASVTDDGYDVTVGQKNIQYTKEQLDEMDLIPNELNSMKIDDNHRYTIKPAANIGPKAIITDFGVVGVAASASLAIYSGISKLFPKKKNRQKTMTRSRYYQQ